MTNSKCLSGVVVVVMILLFLGAVCMANQYTMPAEMPQIAKDFASSMNGILAAAIGAILGIKVTATLASERFKTFTRMAWGQMYKAWFKDLTVTEWIVIGGYFGIAILSATFWGLASWTEDPGEIVVIIPQIARTALGMAVAVVAAALIPPTARVLNSIPGQVFVWVVAVILIGGFVVTIFYAGLYTAEAMPGEMPEIFKDLVSSMNGVLAASLAAIVASGLPGKYKWLKIGAAVAYIVAVVMAVSFWTQSVPRFTDDPTMVVTTIPEIARSAMGVLIGIVAAALGVQRQHKALDLWKSAPA